MIARGFKPVGWVAAVAGAALGCYMLSLNVAAERADLTNVERQIVAAKQDIRSLQTELGTRGRLTQLEHWNSDVLALSAPASKQFLQNEFRLASYSEPQEGLDQRMAKVRMASADTQTAQPMAKPAIVTDFAQDDQRPAKAMMHQASLVLPETTVQDSAPVSFKPSGPKPQIVKPQAARPQIVNVKPQAVKTAAAGQAAPRSAPVRSASLIDSDLMKEIGATSKAERKSGGAGTR